MSAQYHPQASQPHRPNWSQFSIATNNDSLSSGFPYSERLLGLGIPPPQWHDFTVEVANAAKLTKTEDMKAWITGVGTGAASSAFLLVFGPPIGYYIGKSIHKKTVVKKVR